jgi:hypothetical protein
MALVDVLDPNGFGKTGQAVDIEQAWREGLWIGTFNLWVVQDVSPGSYILYQRRKATSTWAPLCLDVSAGGHYEAGEVLLDGLREAKEELGRTYDPTDVTFIGRRLYVADISGRRIRNVVDVCIVRDDAPLSDFQPQESELAGLYRCRIDELLALHRGDISSFRADGVKFSNGYLVEHTYDTERDSFPYNWDHYHQKMACLCKRYLDGMRPILY